MAIEIFLELETLVAVCMLAFERAGMFLEMLAAFRELHLRMNVAAQDDPDDDYSSIGHSSYHGYRDRYSDEESDGCGGDLTACDKACGYCGRCPY